MPLTWQRADDEQWATTVEARLLLDPRIPDGLPARVLTEAHEAVTETGSPAADLFGDPRASRDARGMTPSASLAVYLESLGPSGSV